MQTSIESIAKKLFFFRVTQIRIRNKRIPWWPMKSECCPADQSITTFEPVRQDVAWRRLLIAHGIQHADEIDQHAVLLARSLNRANAARHAAEQTAMKATETLRPQGRL